MAGPARTHTLASNQRMPAMRELLATLDGRRALLLERKHLLAIALKRELDGLGYEQVQGAVVALAEFDGYLHQATGIVSGSHKLRHRGTGEIGLMVEWTRDSLGSPAVIWTPEGESPTTSLLVDLEGVPAEEIDGTRAGADMH